MTGATGNIYAGLHEFTDMMFLLHFLRPNDLFFDIGANVGTYTILASRVCDADTWAFEPDPQTVRQLLRNIEINELGAHVKVHNFALGPQDTLVPFTIGLDTTNHVATSRGSDVRSVLQHTLDTVRGNARPIMMKLDVEGYEAEVLDGATQILANGSVEAIELETVTPKIEQMLRSYSYRKAFYDPFRRQLSEELVGPPSSNSLFVKDIALIADRVKSARAIKILDQVL